MKKKGMYSLFIIILAILVSFFFINQANTYYGLYGGMYGLMGLYGGFYGLYGMGLYGGLYGIYGMGLYGGLYGLYGMGLYGLGLMGLYGGFYGLYGMGLYGDLGTLQSLFSQTSNVTSTISTAAPEATTPTSLVPASLLGLVPFVF